MKMSFKDAMEDIKATALAAGRMGAKELAQALPAFPDSIRPVEEVGMPGNPTQMAVNQENGTFDEWMASKQRDVQPEAQAEMER